jgi:hypothetical protein
MDGEPTTLDEIKAAIEQLPSAERRFLAGFIDARFDVRGERRTPHDEAARRWRRADST